MVNVYENSHSAMPLVYRITSVWGNHEGSMLLWVLILSLFGALLAALARNLPASFKATVLSVQAWIATAFYLFILFTSNPFLRIADSAVRRPRSQSDPAGHRPRDPSAASLSRLCRFLDFILVCGRGADRGPHQRGVGALRAAVDVWRRGCS